MKKLIFCLLGLGILAGCAKLETNSIIFENYIITLSTSNKYELIPNLTSSVKLLKTYTQVQTSGFTSSILIAKQAVSSGTSVETFINKNTQHELKSIDDANIEKEIEIDIPCGTVILTGIGNSLEIEKNNETLYLTQFYFIDSGSVYGISSMTENKKENKEIIKSLKSLSCLKK